MDASLLHHVALAPTVDPNWGVVTTYVAICTTLAVVGAWRLTRSDVQLS